MNVRPMTATHSKAARRLSASKALRRPAACDAMDRFTYFRAPVHHIRLDQDQCSGRRSTDGAASKATRRPRQASLTRCSSNDGKWTQRSSGLLAGIAPGLAPLALEYLVARSGFPENMSMSAKAVTCVVCFSRRTKEEGPDPLRGCRLAGPGRGRAWFQPVDRAWTRPYRRYLYRHRI